MKSIYLRVDDMVHAQLVKEAKADGRSLNSYITRMLEDPRRTITPIAPKMYDRSVTTAQELSYESTAEPRDLGEFLRGQGEEPRVEPFNG